MLCYFGRFRARSLPGVSQMCVKRFAEALEVVPYTLAENAGASPRSQHCIETERAAEPREEEHVHECSAHQRHRCAPFVSV